MRHMLLTLVVVSNCAPAVSAADDAEKLQGTWTFVSYHDSGRDKLGGLTGRLVITKDRMVASADNNQSGRALEFRFKLDPSKDPKWIDLAPVEGGAARKPWPGIYSLDGDDLKICYPEGGSVRATAFESNRGAKNSPNDVLWVLNRGAPKASQEPPKPPELKVLDRIVGRWDYEITAKPAEWSGEGGVTRGTDVHEWALGGRFIHGWGVPEKGERAMWLSTFDTATQNYRFWFFDSAGNTSEFIGKWDEAKETMRWSVDYGNGVRGSGPWQFHGKDRYDFGLLANDSAGKLYLDLSAKLTRQKPGAPGAAKPTRLDIDAPTGATPELKKLDGLVGRWSATTQYKPAVWTPEESKSTGDVTIRWVLNGRVLLEQGKHEPNGVEKLLVRTIDPATGALRSWHFDSMGNISQSTGSWHDATKTLRESAILPNGVGITATVQITSGDSIQWTATAKDSEGKQYLDASGELKRAN